MGVQLPPNQPPWKANSSGDEPCLENRWPPAQGVSFDYSVFRHSRAAHRVLVGLQPRPWWVQLLRGSPSSPHSSAWNERTPDKREGTGSNPVGETTWGCSSVGMSVSMASRRSPVRSRPAPPLWKVNWPGGQPCLENRWLLCPEECGSTHAAFLHSPRPTEGQGLLSLTGGFDSLTGNHAAVAEME